MTVVLLDPDDDSRRIEAAALRYGGYEVATVRTIEQAVRHLRAHRDDAVLVDPAQLDAPQLVGDLRARTDVVIIVVSEGGSEPEIVAALDAGADDYVAKPFGVEELLARLRAALRRAQRPDDQPAAIVTDDFTIDIAARRAFYPNGSKIPLTGIEFRMIEVLVRQPGHLVSQAELLEEVWGPQGQSIPTTYASSRIGSDRNWSPIRPILGIFAQQLVSARLRCASAFRPGALTLRVPLVPGGRCRFRRRWRTFIDGWGCFCFVLAWELLRVSAAGSYLGLRVADVGYSHCRLWEAEGRLS